MTLAHHAAVVWIDHQLAKVFRFDGDRTDSIVIHSTHPHEHLHHKANEIGSGHARVDKAFLERVAAALSQVESILITGPASAKQELASYLAANQPAVAARIAAVEPLDHPSDGQLMALGRRFFKAEDRMQSPFRAGMHQ